MDTKANILIVDNDPKVRKTLSDILGAEGYASIGAVKGKTALDKVKKEKPPVALIDLRLPDMDGLEVMREIKKRSPGTECIVLTGYASQESAIEAVNLGAYGYMQKPYDLDQLVVTIRRAIEKREAEEALQESEERYRSVVENSQAGILIVDDAYRFIYANDELCRILGYSRNEVLGQDFRRFLDDESKQLVADRYIRRQRGEKVRPRYEFNVLRKDGGKRRVEISSTVIEDSAGKVKTVAQILDITERKRVEEALRESEEQFRELIENANDIIYSHDLEGNFTSVNPAATRVYGYTIEETLQLNIAQIVAPDYLPLARQKIQEKLEGSARTEPYELLTYSKEGEPIWVEVSTRLVERDGQPVEVQGIARDITDRKRAEEPLKSAALETLDALSRLVEANDPYTSGHSATVTEIAIKIAQKIGLEDGHLNTLRIAGPLHDVGKVGIPSSVLNKPTGLTEAEWLMIQAHPQVSANVAQQVTAFETAVPAIRHHHERWDGSGYPDGLQGEDIPLSARILAVADGFEAMTSERPYRRARTEEEALAELENGAGTQWDPKVVKAFLKLRKPPTKRKRKGKKKRTK